MNGVLYVAYGARAHREAAESIKTLRQHSDLPVAVVSDKALPGVQHIPLADGGWGGRLAKLSLAELSPFESTLYLDADTRVRGDISAGFDILADGWDVVIAPSSRQGSDVLGNVTMADRQATLAQLGRDVLGLQAGVLWFAKDRARPLFAAWREEWRRFGRQDQGALLRALARVPVRVWLLGSPWNGGDVIQHLWGRAA